MRELLEEKILNRFGISHQEFYQLMRYGIVGVISNVSIFCVYLFITYIGVPYKIAMTTLYLLGTIIGYLGNKRWTFGHKGNALMSFLRYIFAYFLGYLLNLSLLIIFVDHLHYPHQLVQFSCLFVMVVFLYTLQRFFVFAQPAQQ
ncbi:MAG: GtrA family protein [Bdellovibrionales bacterium]|nr:GtrA family protein [Bdellovibrionales bacterium]